MPGQKKVSSRSVRRNPTILDVARLAGVSKSLVSMVIRGDGRVGPERRDAVLHAVQALNYRPNAMARGLVQRRTGILGVMISDLRNPFFADVVSGIQRRAAELGYEIIFTTGDRQAQLEGAAIERLLELRVDGLVIAASRIESGTIAELGRNLPLVVLNRQTADESSDSITNDNLAGAAMAVDHCVGLGHTRIAHIDGGRGAAAAARRAGYEEAMRRHGFERYIQVVGGNFTETGGYRGARLLFQREPYPTAIFCANDLNAIGALNAIEAMGLEVPEDLSLVGYDNTSLAALRHVSLTSVHQPGRELGKMAVDRVFERIHEGRSRPPQHAVVTPRLVIRSTTGPPPGEDTRDR